MDHKPRGHMYRQYYNNKRKAYQDHNRTSFDTNQHSTRRLYFKELEQWSSKDPVVINEQLIDKHKGFKYLLNSTVLTGDTIVLLVKIFAKLCSIENIDHKTKIMNIILNHHFIEKLQKYIWEIQLQEEAGHRLNKYFWTDPNNFFMNVSVITEILLESHPASAYEVLPKTLKSIQTVIIHLKTRLIIIHDDITLKFEKIQEKLFYVQMNLGKHTYISDDNDQPDNFRQLSVYPSHQDILLNRQIYLKKHIIDGAYDSCDHYLDIQFRLLKENFMISLRHEIENFIRFEQSDEVDKQFHIYPHVQFKSLRFVNEHDGVLVQFDSSTEDNKKLTQFSCGSFLCFTNDKFNTFLFGKVANQDLKLIEKGEIIASFEDVQQNYKLYTPYIMVDSCINFNQLNTILKALQDLSEDTFPLKEYIIDVNCNSEPPMYLKQKTVFAINKFLVPLFVLHAWPTAKQINFDDSQLIAFKAALTERISIIVGPAGTGKTYVGVQIIKSLIENKVHWCNNDSNSMSILIICNSNSALDRLLEGVICHSDNIVRIGVSKSELLHNLSISAKRKQLNKDSNLNKTAIDFKNDLEAQLKRMKSWNDILDMLDNYECILDFKHFAKIVPGFPKSWFETASDACLIDWLVGRQICNNSLSVKVSKKWITHIKGGVYKCTDSDNISTLSLKKKFGKLIGQNKPTCLLSLVQMKQYAEFIKSELNVLLNGGIEANRKADLENDLIELQSDIEYFKEQLHEGKVLYLKSGRSTELLKSTELDLANPLSMKPENRWKLYFYWFDLYRSSIMLKIQKLQNKYQGMYKHYLKIKNVVDFEIVKRMLVVGTTIDDAVGYHSLLQELQSPIVLVEEATEILESHLIVSLTNKCQHLILIGDNNKKPSFTSNTVMDDYNLGVSLLERMILNKRHFNSLKVQHRMCQDLFNIIIKVFYEDSADFIQDTSGCSSLPIGVEKCLYFVNQDLTSLNILDVPEQNVYMAKFLLRFADYLILNGYHPEDITILSFHSDHLDVLSNQCSQKNIVITTPENFQGRECKIVLLSLIEYNNTDAKYKTNNDIQVALTSAKEGLFMFGNMENLCDSNRVWSKIKETLEEKNSFGSAIPLRCSIHPDVITHVKSIDDFQQIFINGCNKVCGIALACGHNCTKKCHFVDQIRDINKCSEPCTKGVCNKNHWCSKLCYENCESCQILVMQNLPCGHKYYLPCSIDLTKHQCTKLVTRTLFYGHKISDERCYINPEFMTCSGECDKKAPCGKNRT